MTEQKKAPVGTEAINNIEKGSDKSTKAIEILNDLALNVKRRKFPSVPENCLVKPNYKDRKANDLTRCIIDFLLFSGWQAERINNTGRAIDRRQTYIDALGKHRTIGSLEWVKGTGTNGTADISATIAGRSVKIEVKIGKDRQSTAQKEYQTQTERSGGLYMIAKSFQGFFEWYIKTFRQ